jgi:hypothetical protein
MIGGNLICLCCQFKTQTAIKIDEPLAGLLQKASARGGFRNFDICVLVFDFPTQADRLALSSLRKQGSRNVTSVWIPAFAGMTD